jgi:hypothetical protein
VNKQQKCGECTGKCKACNLSGCTVCLQQYFLDGGACLKCPQNCANCGDSSNCDQCMPGYFRNKTGITVVSCSVCLNNCMNCTDQVSCLQCAAGFFFNVS